MVVFHVAYVNGVEIPRPLLDGLGVVQLLCHDGLFWVLSSGKKDCVVVGTEGTLSSTHTARASVILRQSLQLLFGQQASSVKIGVAIDAIIAACNALVLALLVFK